MFKDLKSTARIVKERGRPAERIYFNCGYCGKESSSTPSAYKRAKEHYCSVECNGKAKSGNRS